MTVCSQTEACAVHWPCPWAGSRSLGNETLVLVTAPTVKNISQALVRRGRQRRREGRGKGRGRGRGGGGRERGREGAGEGWVREFSPLWGYGRRIGNWPFWPRSDSSTTPSWPTADSPRHHQTCIQHTLEMISAWAYHHSTMKLHLQLSW